MATRKENAEELEGMAAKGLKLSGLKNMKTTSKIALGILVIVVLLSILASVLAPFDPYEISVARQAPDALHLFGTDDKGRDILSRILYGGRISLVIGFGSVLFALVTGSIIGAAAAVARKSISEVIMRILDIIMSVPGIALAAVLVTILGKSVPAIIFATESPVSGLVALGVAVIVAVRRGSLLLVALFAAAAVLVTEALINLI